MALARCLPVIICLICYNPFQFHIYDFVCNKPTIIILWAASYRHLAAIMLQMSHQITSNETLFLKDWKSHGSFMVTVFYTFLPLTSVKQTAECQTISKFCYICKEGVTYSLFIIKLQFPTLHRFL